MDRSKNQLKQIQDQLKLRYGVSSPLPPSIRQYPVAVYVAPQRRRTYVVVILVRPLLE